MTERERHREITRDREIMRDRERKRQREIMRDRERQRERKRWRYSYDIHKRLLLCDRERMERLVHTSIIHRDRKKKTTFFVLEGNICVCSIKRDTNTFFRRKDEAGENGTKRKVFFAQLLNSDRRIKQSGKKNKAAAENKMADLRHFQIW